MTTLYTVKKGSEMGQGTMYVRRGNPALKDQPMLWYDDIHFYGRKVELGYGNHKVITREIIDSLANEKKEVMNINFSGCVISRETIYDIAFKNCSFVGTYIEDTTFKNCHFDTCKMTEANIGYTRFFDSRLVNVDFTNTQWKQVSFIGNTMESLQFFSGIMDAIWLYPNNQICNCQGRDSLCITMGGAREDEVEYHRSKILSALFPDIA